MGGGGVRLLLDRIILSRSVLRTRLPCGSAVILSKNSFRFAFSFVGLPPLLLSLPLVLDEELLSFEMSNYSNALRDRLIYSSVRSSVGRNTPESIFSWIFFSW